MKFKELDTVVLNRDLPDHGLRRGDLGAIVHVYESGGVEVEFVTAAGSSGGIVSLEESDLRTIEKNDLVSVRSLRKSA